MVPEAQLEPTDEGLVPKGEGWFVLNAREARWCHAEGRSAFCDFEGEPDFSQLGINISVLGPGEPMAMYHWEADQEDFLVVAGEALLIIEGEERPLRQWDFVHCPPKTKHTIVGAGDGPCVVRRRRRARALDGNPDWGGYTVDEVGAPPRRRRPAGDDRAGRGVRARSRGAQPTRYREGWLPDDERLKLLLDGRGEFGRLRRLLLEDRDRAAERADELLRFERADERGFERRQHLRRQLVEAAAVASVEPAAPAGEQQGLVADAADPVLRLPPAAALDREARPHGVVDAEPEQVVRGRRRRLRQVDRAAEEQPEPRSTRDRRRKRARTTGRPGGSPGAGRRGRSRLRPGGRRDGRRRARRRPPASSRRARRRRHARPRRRR